MSMTRRKLFGILAVLALAASPALGAPITAISLFSTGAGVALDSGLPDNHYLFNIAGSPSPPVAPSVVPSAGIPVSNPAPFNWDESALALGTSKWVGPQADVGALTTPSAAIVYDYWTTFDLTGYNLTSVIITGHWMADNYGQIRLNLAGNLPGAGATIADGSGAYSTWHDFTINSASTGLVAGVNTLKFQVTNAFVAGPNPSGLRVQFNDAFTGDYVIPEPGTLALLGGGLLALGFFRRRR